MGQLVKSLYQKTTSASLALLLILSNFVAMVPIAPQIAGAVSSTITVSPSDLNGWTSSINAGALIDFVHYGSNVGLGALKFTTPSDVNGSVRTTKAVNLKLSEITNLTYDSKKESGSAEAAVAFRLGLDTDGDGIEDMPVVYEPYYNLTAHNPESVNSSITSNWQTWDVLNGKFWGSWNSGGGAYATNKTLEELSAGFPDARIVRLSLGVGTYNANWVVYGDNVVVNDTTYDFEPDLNPTLNLDTYFVNSSYKGIGVDIEVDELIDATAVEVKVERENGEPVIKTNKITGGVLGSLNTGAPSQVTAPIVIQHGTYDEAESSSWNQPAETWNSTNIPTSITVTISRGTNPALVKTVNLAEISTNLATLSELMPLDVTAPTATLEVTGGKVVDGTRYVRPGDKIKFNVVASDTESGLDRASHIVFKLKENGTSQDGVVCGGWHSGKFPVDSNELSGSYTMNACNGGTVPSDRLYGLAFRVYDNAGNNNRIPNSVYAVDGTKPVVSSFNAPSIVSGQLNLSATANDVVVGGVASGVESVKFFLADLQNGVCKNNYSALAGYLNTITHQEDGEYSTSFDVTGLMSGEYCVLVSARDNVTNNSTPLFKTITVDNTVPTTPAILKPSARQWFSSTPIATEWTEATDDNGIAKYQVAYAYDDGHSFAGSTCVGEDISGTNVFCRDASSLIRNHTPALGEQGKVTIWVRAIDNAGNASAWSTPVYYYYDHEAPVTDINVSEVAGKKFTVSGHATDNEQLNRVYVQLVNRETSVRYGGTTINLIGEGESADWSREYNIADLPEGNYAAHVSVVDMAGNTSSAGWTDNFFVDNTRPVVELLSPNDGDFNPTTLSIKATDNHHLHRIVANIYDEDGSTLVGPACSQFVDGANKLEDIMDCSFPALADGVYILRFNAHDKAGNVAQTKTIKFVIDTTSPTIDNLAITKSLTNENSIVLSGTVFDLNLKDYNVRVYNSDKSALVSPWTGFAGNANVDNDTLATLNIESLADGSYWVRIWANDLAGNSTGHNPHIYIPFTIDRTAPEVGITSAMQTSTAAVEFNGFVSDPHFEHYYCWLTNESGQEVSGTRDANCITTWASDLQRNGNPATTNTTGQGSIDSPVKMGGFNISDVSSGNYTVNLVGVDRLGNRSNAATFGIAIDTDSPIADITSPATDGEILNGEVIITGEVDAAEGNLKSHWFEITNPDNSLSYTHQMNAVGLGYSFILDTSKGDGQYKIRYVATDKFGNRNDDPSRSNTLIRTLIVDNTAPSVAFTNPTDANLFNSDVEVRATISDENLRHYWVQVKKDGSVIYSQTISSSGITDAPIYTATEDGDYIITIAARDLAGGTSTSGNRSGDVVKSFTIDKTAPILTILSPEFNDEFLESEDIEIETFVGDNRKISSVSVEIEGQDGTLQTDLDFDTDNGGSSFFTISAGTLPIGEYKLIASARDEAGNLTEAYTTIFVIEPTPETPEENSDDEDSEVNEEAEDGQGGSPEQNSESSSNNNSDNVALNPVESTTLTPAGTDNQTGQAGANNQAPDENDNNDTDAEEDQSVDEPQGAEDTESSNEGEGNQDIAGARDEEDKNGMLAWYWWLAILAALAGGWWFIFGRRKKDEEEKA